MADLSKVPPSIRAKAEREAALIALPSIIARLDALEEWAEQNGWDVATGFIQSDLKTKSKLGRPRKEVTDAPSSTTDQD